MTDESRGSPLPQRERGATEAGARPAPARVGAPALPDDLRQRMQASVDAERAQNRERAAEMLRHPPQRLVGGERPERPERPRGDADDRKPAPGANASGKPIGPRTPETTPISVHPYNKASIVDNGQRQLIPPAAPPTHPRSSAAPLASPRRARNAGPARSPRSHRQPSTSARQSAAGNRRHSAARNPSARHQPASARAARIDLFTPPAGSPSAPAPAPAPTTAARSPVRPLGHLVRAQAPPAPPAPPTTYAPRPDPGVLRQPSRRPDGGAAGAGRRWGWWPACWPCSPPARPA